MTIENMADHRELPFNCAVCKKNTPGKTLSLEPHTNSQAVVFIHTKCMGGLPLIALKWYVLDERVPEKPTLLDVLTLGLEAVTDFTDETGGEK